jgi:hypothetical protein
MPVFFYIDPEFAEDPAMAKIDEITLSYTFFQAKDASLRGLSIPANPHAPRTPPPPPPPLQPQLAQAQE